MPVISIFSGSPAIRKQAGELILKLARGQPDTLQADCYYTFSGFLDSANKTPLPHTSAGSGGDGKRKSGGRSSGNLP